MKKIFLLCAMLLSCVAFAQKTFYIFNFSSYSVQVGDITTKSSATSGYPTFRSAAISPAGLFIIGPGQTYVLENPNPTYFPFESPLSVPYISTWERRATATSSWVNFASSSLNNVIAVPQMFYSFKFQVGTDIYAGNLGGGTLFADTNLPVTKPSWEATYEVVYDEGGGMIIIYDL